MKFVFDNIEDNLPLNFTECTDRNGSGIKRFTVAPVISTILRCITVEAHIYKDFVNQISVSYTPPKHENYIIPVGVAHSPYDWCGPDNNGNGFEKKAPNRQSLFAHIKPEYLLDLQSAKAWLLIDQTHEGYHTDWLWEWFHNNCDAYKIPPSQIIYITGNMHSESQYKEWADHHGLEVRLHTFGWPHFECVVNEISKAYREGHPDLPPPPALAKSRKLPDFEFHLDYKSKHKIKTFNVLQKRPRGHRIWFFKYLFDAGLLDNIITMNWFNFKDTFYEGRTMTKEEYDSFINLLPILPYENPVNYTGENFSSGDGANYVLSLNDITILDSWCTVVSEASYGEWERNCFLSEKTFKPIICQQPFIVLGSKGSLRHLKDLGYKTFEPFIDESYDDLSCWERMPAIIAEMTRIHNMSDTQKAEWFKGMEDILKFNFNHMRERSSNYVLDIFTKLKNYTEQ
jgi:hypothetical protein